MKLFFINRYFYPDHSATSQMLSDLAFYLSAKGYSVHVVTSRLRYDQPKTDLPVTEVIHDVSVHRVKTSRFGRHSLPGRAIDYLTFYVAACWRVFKVVEQGDVIITKTDPPMISVPMAWIARIRGAKLINWLQDLFPEVAIELKVSGLNSWFGRLLLRMRNISLNSAAMNVVIGEGMKNRLVEEGIPTKQISVIHNWSDETMIKSKATSYDDMTVSPTSNDIESTLSSEASESNLKEEWGLRDKFVVGYSGNLGRVHEFDTVLDAATRLRTKKSIKFLFIGGGVQQKRVEQEGKNRGLENLVFKPYQSREMLSESLAVPDVHLVLLRPNLEGLVLPSKLYGILAAGKPALFVGNSQGEIPLILNESGAGVSIQSGDSESLVQHILELSSSAMKVDRMGQEARRLFDLRFSSRHAFRHWNGVIEATFHLVPPGSLEKIMLKGSRARFPK